MNFRWLSACGIHRGGASSKVLTAKDAKVELVWIFFYVRAAPDDANPY